MKSLSIGRYKNILSRKNVPTSQVKQGISGIGNALKTSFQVIKKVAVGVNNIATIGGALILLIVVTLFLGVFGSLSNDYGTNTSLLPLSTEVMEYKEIIEDYAKQYEMMDYVDLI